MSRLAQSIVAAVATLGAAAAPAAVDLEIPNGTTVSSALTDAAAPHRYRAVCPAGARLSVTAKAAKGGPDLAVRIVGPYGSEIAAKAGRNVALKNVAAIASGTHVIEVASADAATTGSYSLSVAWKNPAAFKQTVTVDPGGRAAYVFAAARGAVATAKLAPGRKSAAAPSLAAVVAPDGRTTELAGGATGPVPLGATGDHLLVVGGGAAGGLVNLTLKVKSPKAARLSFALGANDAADGAGVTTVQTIGPAGGALAAETGPITGASVAVAPGAVTSPTTFLLGPARALAGDGSGAAAGPAVFFGPEGLAFGAGAVTVRLPYDESAFGADTSKLRVYTRDAAGVVSEVNGVTIDPVGRFVSFAVAHFSSYQVVRAFAFQETQRLTKTPPPTYVTLGRRVAVSGDVAAAALQGGVSGEGVAVYHRTGGTFVAETDLRPAGTPQSGDFFGYAISVSGDRVLAGAVNRRNGPLQTGGAFIFLRDPAGTWSQEAELTSPAAGEDAFGAAVAIEGDTAVVGADRAFSDHRGAVFVFTRDPQDGSWTHRQTLRAFETEGSGFFGGVVALSGDTLVARSASASVPDRLVVYRRTAGVWARAAVLTYPDVPRLLRDARIDGATLVVAGADPAGSSFGEVRVFADEGASFRHVARFTSADVAGAGENRLDALGTSLALRGDLLVVGAPTRTVFAGGVPQDTGSAHVFQRIGEVWRHALRLRGRPGAAFPAARGDRYGSSVALDGTTAIVGAESEDTDVADGGAVYVVELAGN